MSEDSRQAIVQCLKTACEALEIPFKENDLVAQSYTLIPKYVEKVNPEEYYQWFCSLWQSIETLYAQDVKEEEWANTVENVVAGVQNMYDEVNPKLRAMCVSYVLASLQTHKVAQTRALRLLIQMSTDVGLTQDPEFFKWIIGIMKKLLQDAIEIKNNRELFIKTLVNFFTFVKEYDHLSLSVLCSFLQNNKAAQYIQKTEELAEPIKAIAKNCLNSTFRGNQIFDFEIIFDTDLLKENLDKPHLEFLIIFVQLGYREFEQLLQNYPNFIQENDLKLEQMELNIRMLSLISLMQNKREVQIEEAEDATGLSGLDFKRLVIQLNETKNALLKIVSENGGTKIQNKFCQPRLFNEEQDNLLIRNLQTAIMHLTPGQGR